MNTAIDASASRATQQAIENLRKELHKIYWDAVGKEPDPEVVRAEAEALVTKYGPIASLEEMLA